MELIVLPIYNQAHITPKRIAELHTFVQDVDNVLIVDDGSEDNIGELIETNDTLTYARHENSLGYGGVFITALEYARKHDCDTVLFLDLSVTNFTAPISRLREKLIAGDEIINASRIPITPEEDDDFRSFNAQMPISQRLNSATGLRLHDVFSPFKGLKVAALEEMTLEEFDESIILQLFIQGKHFKKRINEIYISDIKEEGLVDLALLTENQSHYLNFIQGELLLYPQE